MKNLQISKRLADIQSSAFKHFNINDLSVPDDIKSDITAWIIDQLHKTSWYSIISETDIIEASEKFNANFIADIAMREIQNDTYIDDEDTMTTQEAIDKISSLHSEYPQANILICSSNDTEYDYTYSKIKNIYYISDLGIKETPYDTTVYYGKDDIDDETDIDSVSWGDYIIVDCI